MAATIAAVTFLLQSPFRCRNTQFLSIAHSLTAGPLEMWQVCIRLHGGGRPPRVTRQESCTALLTDGWLATHFLSIPPSIPPHTHTIPIYSSSNLPLQLPSRLNLPGQVWQAGCVKPTSAGSGRLDKSNLRRRGDGGEWTGEVCMQKPMKTTLAVKQRDPGRRTEAGGRWCNVKTEGGKGGGRDGGV